MKLPFYGVLTPSIRYYIAERIQVEHYFPMEMIPINDAQKLDFLFVETGSIQFELEDISLFCEGDF